MKMMMMMNREEIYNRFLALSASRKMDDEFVVDIFSKGLPHKLGMSNEGYPMLFIECSDEKITSNIHLQLFSASFNRICKLKEVSGNIQKKYTILELLSNNNEFQKYFLEVMFLVLSKLPPKPKVEQLKQEISKVVTLFMASPQISKDAVKGLWAELFIIEQSKVPQYLIKAWHVSTEDKYDFNDGIDKIEVKCTSNEERVHHFAINQLHPNQDSQLLIASLIVVNSGMGLGIFDLVDSISSRVTDTETLLKLNEEVMLTIGPHVQEAKEMKFDYKFAKENLKFFDYKLVPSIKISDVPIGVTDVHFASCLKGIQEFDLTTVSGNLFKSV